MGYNVDVYYDYEQRAHINYAYITSNSNTNTYKYQCVIIATHMGVGRMDFLGEAHNPSIRRFICTISE